MRFISKLLLGSHRRFLSINSHAHWQNAKCRQVPTRELRVNQVDDLLVDEMEYALLLVDFC